MQVLSKAPAAVNVDGETDTANEATFEILPHAFRFVIPTTSTYIEDRKNGVISDQIG